MKNRLVFTILCLCATSLVFAADKLTPAEFARAYAAAVIEQFPGAEVEIVDEIEIRVVLPDDGGEKTSFLSNAYADYQNNPDQLEAVLENYIGGLWLSKELDHDRLGPEQVFPVIKDSIFIEQARETFKDNADGKELVYERLNEVLFVVYAFDTPTAIRYMNESDLERLELKRSELRDLSLTNLRRAIPNLQLEGDPSALSMLVADGTYEASFILFDAIWTSEQFPVKGDIVIYMPTRDLVLITGSEDEANLARVREIVYNPEVQWSHIVAEVGFIRRGNRWMVYRP